MFPCTKCGLCCQEISTVDELKDYDLGNGVCRNFDNASSSCQIYETRPNICKIDKMYEIKYVKFFAEKKDFYLENAKVCNKLQLSHKLERTFKVIIGD